MKLFFAAAAFLFSMSAMASLKDGNYSCSSPKGQLEVTYKIRSLPLADVELPFLEVTRTYLKDTQNPASKEVVYVVKGIANYFTDSEGTARLTIGAMNIELKDGRPACVK